MHVLSLWNGVSPVRESLTSKVCYHFSGLRDGYSHVRVCAATDRGGEAVSVWGLCAAPVLHKEAGTHGGVGPYFLHWNQLLSSSGGCGPGSKVPEALP